MSDWQLHGRRTAVLVSEVQHQRLCRSRPRFVEFMRSSPLAGVEFEIRLDRSPARDPRLR